MRIFYGKRGKFTVGKQIAKWMKYFQGENHDTYSLYFWLRLQSTDME